MSVYANGLQIQLNEIVFLEFMEKSQAFDGPVARIVVQVDVLRQMHEVIGNAIVQYDTKLAELSKVRSSMN